MRPARVLPLPFLPALLAGIAAGAVAGLVNIGLLALMHSVLPPIEATGVSSLVAGVLAGVTYWLWARVFTRPVAALWIATLLIATADTIVIFALPFPTAGRRLGLAPLAGLLTPILQILALFGVGGSAPVRMPVALRPAYIIVHYATAIIASLLVPRLARPPARSV